MSSAEIRGVVHGHTVVLSGDSCALPEGTEVVVTPVATPKRGSPQAVLAALAKHPPMSAEVAEKMRADIEMAFEQIEDDDA
ncbi:MAG: hypothetical protein SGJ19_15750 [Planctomycetia bacterium]|nr:hypothetical protein [Planctomycetia bacterium]